MTDEEDRRKETARILRDWYALGKRGLGTICKREDMTPASRSEIIKWYALGYKGIDGICKNLEREIKETK